MKIDCSGQTFTEQMNEDLHFLSSCRSQKWFCCHKKRKIIYKGIMKFLLGPRDDRKGDVDRVVYSSHAQNKVVKEVEVLNCQEPEGEAP